MPVKDYYKILELSPNASISEVKKNFRRLALKYHPDTNQGNRYAEAWYHEIQEAYVTLTDPYQREAYHQQRWLVKSDGRAFSDLAPLTPAFILKKSTELLVQVKNIDHFRMDHSGLQQQLLRAVENESIDVLNSYRDDSINLQLVQTILACLYPLEFPLLKPVILQLQKINGGNTPLKATIDRYYEKRRKLWLWEKYQGLIILIITIILCFIIFLAA